MDVEDCLQQAEKALKKSFFHKPNPKQAMLLYQQAADICIKQKQNDKAIEILNKALQVKLDDNQLCEQVYIDIARCKEQLGQVSTDDLINTAHACQRNGHFEQAAQYFYQAAAISESQDDAKKFVEEAEEALRSQNKANMTNILLLDTIDQIIQYKQYPKAIKLIDIAKIIYSKNQSEGHKLDKIVLWGCVICIVIGDTIKLNELKEYFNDFDGFYGQFAYKLIEAQENEDGESFKEAIQQYASRVQMPQELLQDLRAVRVSEFDL